MKTKKLLLKMFLPVFLCFVFLFNLTACSDDRFMKDSELMSGVDKIGGTITLRVNAYGTYWETFEIDFTLEYRQAPITVTNFVYLVQSGFYDYNSFEENVGRDEADMVKPIMHRLVHPTETSTVFLLQGGGYKTNIENTSDIVELRTGGLDYTIKGEFENNGWTKNTISHKAGVISMARQSGYDTAASEFFITLGDSSVFDGDYAAFATIDKIDGKLMTILKDTTTSSEKFSFSSTYLNEYPKNKIEIVGITVNTSISFPQSLRLPK